MKTNVIDLNDVAKIYVEKAVAKVNGTVEPSVNFPSININCAPNEKIRFAFAGYLGEGDNPFIDENGNMFDLNFEPASSWITGTGSPDGMKFLWSKVIPVHNLFKGAEGIDLYVWEVDTTKISSIQLPVKISSTWVNNETGDDGEIDFPDAIVNVNFTQDPQAGNVYVMDFAEGVDSMINAGTFVLGKNLESKGENAISTTQVISANELIFPYSATTANTLARFTGGTIASIQLRKAKSNASTITLCATMGNDFLDTSRNQNGTCAIELVPTMAGISLGMNTTDGTNTFSKRPVVVIDSATNNMHVYILGEDCEWRTLTIDGQTVKVLAAKG